MTYAQRLRALLSPMERRVFKKLSSPEKIQDFLDGIPINFEEKGETIHSPRMVLRKRRAHCVEGALFAAASLAYHGLPPLLMDFQTVPSDEDHVVALFKKNGLWGAISKTNHSVLRWRDPVYKTPRELAMSYFHEYAEWSGKKSLRAFSKPFDLRRYKEDWVTTQDKRKLERLVEELDDSPHSTALPKAFAPHLRPASAIELRAMKIVEWKPKR